MLQEIYIPEFQNSAGKLHDICLTYQFFGRDPEHAPVVLVNHALTGNSQVSGDNGWWNAIVGRGKAIDTDTYSVLAFNIPGNGYNGNEHHLIHNYKEFRLKDVAKLQSIALQKLGISKLFAIIGGSIGGALAWELAVLQPNLAEIIIPIASDYKTTDWVLANCKVQDQILNNSSEPVKDARMHAMTFYRTPQSLTHKFKRSKHTEEPLFKVESWLKYHGDQLDSRFLLASYKLMNHLLTTIDISEGTNNFIEVAQKINSSIHLITIDSDWFFLAEENWDTYVNLSMVKKDIRINEIKSIHGHDAFLIETNQVENILRPIFKTEHKSELNGTQVKGRIKL